MTTDSTSSIDGGEVNPDSTDQFDSDDAAGDAVSGVSESGDGPPTPTGSVPPGPVAPGDDPVDPSDNPSDPAELPPLEERMF